MKGSVCPNMFTDERGKQNGGRTERRNSLPRAELPHPTYGQALGTPSPLQATCEKQGW